MNVGENNDICLGICIIYYFCLHSKQTTLLKTVSQIKKIARKTIEMEATSIAHLASYIDDAFAAAVKLLFDLRGRVVVTGIGKSAIIASKIVATFNSTGTPSIFMHAADAIHGDLGMVQKEDVVVCLSKSGDTPEIKVLAPLIKLRGNKIIAIVGNVNSFLAKNSDYILNSSVESEACPNNLAPTSSTTAQLVLGDAIAVCLLECREFSSKEFAQYHPGGILGKRLYLRVSELCSNNAVPEVKLNDTIETAIIEISSKRLGVTAVTDAKRKLLGIITDGDLRRMLQNKMTIEKIKVKDIMSPDPKTIDLNTLAADALRIMEDNKITQLLVTENGKYVGVVHLHDILKEGII